MGTARSMTFEKRKSTHLLGSCCSFKRKKRPGPVLVHESLQTLEAYLKAVLHRNMQVGISGPHSAHCTNCCYPQHGAAAINVDVASCEGC